MGGQVARRLTDAFHVGIGIFLKVRYLLGVVGASKVSVGLPTGPFS